MTSLSQELLQASKTKNISPVLEAVIDHYWEDTIWPLLREVPGFLMLYDEAWTYEQIKTGRWQVWAYSDSEIRGIVVTRINVFPRCKVLDVMAMSGNSGIEFMNEFEDIFEFLGQQQGCSYLSLSVRPGLERILVKKYAAVRAYGVVVRAITEQRSS